MRYFAKHRLQDVFSVPVCHFGNVGTCVLETLAFINYCVLTCYGCVKILVW